MLSYFVSRKPLSSANVFAYNKQRCLVALRADLVPLAKNQSKVAKARGKTP